MMTQNEINLLALYLDRAVKTDYFTVLENLSIWKNRATTGNVKVILQTLIGYMLSDVDSDIREQLEKEPLES